MKKIKNTLIFLSFIFLTLGCQKRVPVEYVVKPKLISINIIDRDGMSETTSQKERLEQFANVDFLKTQPYQKILRVFSRDPFGSIKAIVTSYYPNGQVKQYLEIKDNRAYGAYREWFSDGTLKLDTFVIGGIADLNTAAEKSWLFDGESRVFDESGHLIALIQYHKGELSGNSTYYHKNGNIWKIIPYKNNLADGVFETYLENGELLQRSEISKDLKHGKTTRFWNKNQIASDEYYVDGNLVEAFYYDPCGQLVSKIENGEGFRSLFGKTKVCEKQEFHEGVQNGKVEVYNTESQLIKIYHVKNEMKDGEEIEFYLNGTKNQNPKISIQWSQDKIHGTVKTWYENGVQESQREMTNNMKNGLLTAWYKDGSVMLLESYDHEKLVKGKYFKRQEKTAISEVVNGNGIATLHDMNGNFIKKIHYYHGNPQN